MDHHHFNSSTCDSKYPFQTCSLFGNAKRFMHGRLHDISLVFLSSPYTLWGLQQSLRKDSFFFGGGRGFQMLQKFVSPYLLGSKCLPGLLKKTLFFPDIFPPRIGTTITTSQPHHHRSEALNIEVLDSCRSKGVFSWGKLGRCFSCKAWRWTVLEHPENRWKIFFSIFEVSQSKQIWCLNLANTKGPVFFSKSRVTSGLRGKLLVWVGDDLGVP